MAVNLYTVKNTQSIAFAFSNKLTGHCMCEFLFDHLVARCLVENIFLTAIVTTAAVFA